ncbi:MAG: hypothetical protein HUJ54_14465 [Erysipelotrichaceae bacterium]|nr:hypothetical protein [Erysipelotrichaceae bacterium]
MTDYSETYLMDAMENLGLEDMPWGFAPEFGHIRNCPPLVIGDSTTEQEEDEEDNDK